MITPSFGLTAAERVLPRLALNFTTASLDSRVTFTRTGDTATVTNSSGFIAGINADLPRFDYDPITHLCKGLLIEQQSTNLLTYSDQFNNASWVKLNATIAVNSIISPDGTTNADTMVETIANGYHRVSQSFTPSVIGSFTSSVFAKQGERIWLAIQNTFGATNTTQLYNLSTGTLGSIFGAGGTATITNVGNGWYRCTLTTVTSTLGAGACNIYVSSGDNLNTYTGDGTSGLYIWGAQLEAGAFATSYIPTEATALTRNADVATMTGTNFSDWFNATEGTFDVSFSSTGATPYAGAFWVSDAVKTSSLGFSCGVNGPTNFGYMRGADGSLKSLSLGSYTAYTTESIVLAYTAANFYGSANASTVSSAAITAFPTSEALSLGYQSTAGGSSYLNGHLKKLSYYKQKVTSPEMQAFSKE